MHRRPADLRLAAQAASRARPLHSVATQQRSSSNPRSEPGISTASVSRTSRSTALELGYHRPPPRRSASPSPSPKLNLNPLHQSFNRSLRHQNRTQHTATSTLRTDSPDNGPDRRNTAMAPPQGKYPAKLHAKNVVDWLKSHGEEMQGVVYIEGQKLHMLEDSDMPRPFRQRRYFFYLTGCELPDCAFAYDLAKQKSTLFIPPVDPDEVVWSGLPTTIEEAMTKYDVDEVRTTDKINPFLASEDLPKAKIYAMGDQVSDEITFLSFDAADMTTLRKAIDDCRIVKTPFEVEMIRHANSVSTEAHKALMRAAKTVENERELAAIFHSESIARGCPEQSYPPITAAGTNAATLHYTNNNESTKGKQMVLVDAGATYDCYASDITRTWPLSGSFTPEARKIYDLVLKMQKETIPMVKAGVLWDDIHAHAHWVAVQGLVEIGILKGDPKEIFDARTSVAFFPHGLGHYLGMDTHDVGGKPNSKDENPMFRYLRLRVPIVANSVVTVEPGVYFCRFIIEPYLRDEKHSKYIDQAVLDKYWDVGGVRIEDNVLVTESGYENLTETPKEAEDVLRLVNAQA